MRVFNFGLACSALAVACGGKSAAPAQPPSAPAGLAATGGNGQIALTWTAVSGATSYVVLRGDAAGTEAALPTAATAAAYTDTGLMAGKTYYYAVEAKSAAGVSAKSNEASALTAPAAPAGLSVWTSDTSSTVQWTASPGATDYLVLRAPGGTTTFNQVAATTTPGASDSGLTPNTAYVYAVRAHNVSGTSANATFNATTAPAAPTGLTAAASNHHVTLSWTAVAGAGSGGYRVLRSTSASGPFIAVGTAAGTNYTDTFLTNNTPYDYVVHTIGGAGESGDSGSASATPFIEICAVDSASFAVSVYDGTANGNVAPKRSFGWSTGIAEGTGIGTDGTNIYVASKYTQTINIYPRLVSGNTPPTSTITLPGQPTALTVDAVNSNVYVGIGSKVYVYRTSDTGSPGPQWTLTINKSVVNSGITGIQVYHSTTVNQTFVLFDNNILVYNNGDSGTTAPLKTITPANTDSGTSLVGPAYDLTGNAVFVGWYGNLLGEPNFASYSIAGASGVTQPTLPPITTTSTGGNDTFLNRAVPGGIILDGSNLWLVAGGNYAVNSSLLQFPRTAYGDASPTAGFVGSNTHIFKPGALLLDSTNSELWFINGKNGASAYSKTSISVNSAPARALTGDSTGLYVPVAVGADAPNGEIVVLNQAFAGTISVYPNTASNPALPARTLAGANLAQAGRSLAVDQVNGEYWVNWIDASGYLAFEAFARSPGGNVTNLRSIGGATSTFPGNFQAMLYDSKAAQIEGEFQDPTTGNYYINAWDRTANGDATPARTGTLATQSAAYPVIDFAHDLLFILTSNTSLSAFPRAFSSGALTQTRSFDPSQIRAQAAFVDGEGNEIYFQSPNAIVAVSASSSGVATASRIITGSATHLYNTAGMTICN